MKRKNSIIFIIITLLLLSFCWFVCDLHHVTNVFFKKETIPPISNVNSSPKNESCFICHTVNGNFSPFHNPNNIGCVSCHLGNPNASDKSKAHEHLIAIPGNLSDAKETCGKCHPNELNNVNHSLMTTNSGIVAIDKYILGDTDSPNLAFHIRDIGHDASDTHIRNLCANCHLGSQKTTFGPITELSRGGGCNACHLNYSDKAKSQLTTYLNTEKKQLPSIHPSTDINITDTHCYGCHSRSSRISTNYIGLHETLLEKKDLLPNDTSHTISLDGRIYSHQKKDTHHTLGLLCIDCHSSNEVMGDGKDYLHEEDAVKIRCQDCHIKDEPNTITFDQMDQESKLIFMLRKYLHEDQPMIATQKENHALVNTFIDSTGNAFLISKKDGKHHLLSKQGKCSKDKVHEDVSCSACHTSWAPRCIACHTTYEKDMDGYDLLDKKAVEGSWIEYVDAFESGPPALGVAYRNNERQILPAVPGMIMTLDNGNFDEKKEPTKFHRLFAPNVPHTIQKEVRDCQSCHSNSITLGYGEGELNYNKNDQSWAFLPNYQLSEYDQLPEDAWIGYLAPIDTSKVYSTRTYFRPFNVEEQKNMLLVGACLTCHKDDSKVMRKSLELGVQRMIRKMSKSCEW